MYRNHWILSLYVLLTFLGCKNDNTNPVSEKARFAAKETQIVDSLKTWGIETPSYICILTNKYFCRSCIHPEIGKSLLKIVDSSSQIVLIVTTNPNMAKVLRPELPEDRFLFKQTSFLDTIDYPIYDWTIIKVEDSEMTFSYPAKSLSKVRSILDTIQH